MITYEICFNPTPRCRLSTAFRQFRNAFPVTDFNTEQEALDVIANTDMSKCHAIHDLIVEPRENGKRLYNV